MGASNEIPNFLDKNSKLRVWGGSAACHWKVTVSKAQPLTRQTTKPLISNLTSKQQTWPRFRFYCNVYTPTKHTLTITGWSQQHAPPQCLYSPYQSEWHVETTQRRSWLNSYEFMLGFEIISHTVMQTSLGLHCDIWTVPRTFHIHDCAKVNSICWSMRIRLAGHKRILKDGDICYLCRLIYPK